MPVEEKRSRHLINDLVPVVRKHQPSPEQLRIPGEGECDSGVIVKSVPG